MPEGGRLVRVHDTRLWLVERGAPDGMPVLVLHGGPGLDHTEFGDYLDPLAEDGRYRLVLLDQRGQGRSARDAPPETWTLHQFASDVSAVAADLGVEDYAVLGHSFGAFVALQHAVDAPGAADATIVTCGVPSSRFLAAVEDNLANFEPAGLREQVAASWAAEANVQSPAELGRLILDQLPFHFADPADPRIADYVQRSAGGRYAPDVLRRVSNEGYGDIEVEALLPRVTQPVLVCAGRHDRTCPVAAAEATAAGIRNSELVVFEDSGHMPFVEETERYLGVVRSFLDRVFVAA